jgi:hypothetical protein
MMLLSLTLGNSFRFVCINKREGVSKSFRTESMTKYALTFGIIRLKQYKLLWAAKLTRLTHKK